MSLEESLDRLRQLQARANEHSPKCKVDLQRRRHRSLPFLVTSTPVCKFYEGIISGFPRELHSLILRQLLCIAIRFISRSGLTALAMLCESRFQIQPRRQCHFFWVPLIGAMQNVLRSFGLSRGTESPA